MFRFTIRELLVLTLTAGLAVGWWLDRQHLTVRLAAAEKWRTIAGGLEHILRGKGWKAGMDESRLWAGPDWSDPKRIDEVGVEEFEPKLNTERPQESYYDQWVNAAASRGSSP